MIIALESSLEEALNVNANSPSASWKAHADATICNQFLSKRCASLAEQPITTCLEKALYQVPMTAAAEINSIGTHQENVFVDKIQCI